MMTFEQGFFATITTIISVVSTMIITNDITYHNSLQRERRALIFPPGAVFQVSLGLSNPVSDIPNRTLVYSFAIQMVFGLPTDPTIWRVPPSVDNKRRVSKRALLSTYIPLEEFLEDHGFNGRTCLLRSICEAARSPFHHEDMGLLEEMAHAIFTPSLDILAEDANCSNNNPIPDYIPLEMQYLSAECLGKSDGDCLTAYPDCPNLPLDYFSQKIYCETPYE